MQTLWTPSKPAIKRHKGLLVDAHKTDWVNCGQKHGGTRFRVRGFFPDRHGYGVSCNSFFRHFIDDPEDAEDFWRGLREGRWPSWLPSAQDYPGLVYEFATVVFLTTTGSGTYSIPATWNNSNNSIEGIGGGQGGLNSASGVQIGGEYCIVSNESHSPSASITISIGVGGATATAGGDTSWQASPTLLAPGGASSTTAVGTTKYAGGSTSLAYSHNGAGGGAGAPSGAGQNGGDGAGIGYGDGGAGGGGAGARSATEGSSWTGSGAGGKAQDGTLGGVRGSSPGRNGSHGSGGAGGTGGGGNGGNGGAGIEWDSTHGAGGGAGGGGAGGGGGDPGNPGGVGGVGGLYGGAGGQAGLGNPVGTGGVGGQGILVVSYAPLPPVAFFGHTIPFA